MRADFFFVWAHNIKLTYMEEISTNLHETGLLRYVNKLIP